MKHLLPHNPRLLLALEFLLYAVLAAAMLHLTWLTWPDAFVDFSRELYLPWRVSCGDVLYRDIAYYFGPLSVYANAALFAILGRPSIHALFALNFVFWLATLFALRALLRRIASPLAAAVAVSSFILLFSFNRYTEMGNDNFLAPYSHELVRGFLFALLSLLALDSAFRRRSPPLHFLSGFLLGLSLFTKPEIAVATVAASATFFLVHFRRDRERPARDDMAPGTKSPSFFPRDFSLFTLHFSLHAVGAFCAVGMVLLPLSLALGSFFQALRDGLLKLYLDCFDADLTSIPYFQAVLGTNRVFANSLRLFRGGLLAILPFVLAAFLLPRLPSRTLRGVAAALLAAATAALAFFAFIPLNYALPLAPVAFAGILIGEHWRRRRAQKSPSALSPLPAPRSCALAFAVFALVLVSKIALNAGVFHYGFVLALPSFCCAVALAFRPPLPPFHKALALAAFAAFALAGVGRCHRALSRDHVSVPLHDNACRSDPVNAAMANAALDWIRANTPPDSTLVAFPEGAVLNVLSGRRAPNPYFMLEPGTYLRGGSPAILAAYSNAPPDTLVFVRTAMPFFGLDYAQDLLAFLDPLYASAFTLSQTTPDGHVPYLLVATRIPPSP